MARRKDQSSVAPRVVELLPADPHALAFQRLARVNDQVGARVERYLSERPHTPDYLLPDTEQFLPVYREWVMATLRTIELDRKLIETYEGTASQLGDKELREYLDNIAAHHLETLDMKQWQELMERRAAIHGGGNSTH